MPLDGAIYGLASHGAFLGAFKPGNRSKAVKGCIWPAALRIRTRHANGDDVRLDRRGFGTAISVGEGCRRQRQRPASATR